jgi:hypothetical protein
VTEGEEGVEGQETEEEESEEESESGGVIRVVRIFPRVTAIDANERRYERAEAEQEGGRETQ